MLRLAQIAIPVPLANAFTYRVPDELAYELQAGSRVLCEFGRRKVLGIVLEIGPGPSPVEPSKLKSISAIIDAEPVLPVELLRFVRELAAYYFAPIGEVMRLVVPAVERDKLQTLRQQGKLELSEQPSRARQVGGRLLTYAQATEQLEEPGTVRGQAAALLALLRATGSQPVARLAERYSNARPALKKLADRGLVTLDKLPAERAPLLGDVTERDSPPQLNEAQLGAVALLEKALLADAAPELPASKPAPPRGFVLFGVTGSGKTEVYMHAIARCLEMGRGALVLVPEIALTPQLLGRFRARFGNEVALLHSGLAAADRHQMWCQLREGKLRVAVGARSALFAPVQQLGLLVVDEEHDSSFKQEEGVRYHARDMALLRAHRAGAVVVLGSATPSLEAIALTRRSKLTEIRLPERAFDQASMPSVEIVDLKRIGPGPSGDRLLSLPLHRALEATMSAGEQAIIFLNRRGFSPSIICNHCGVVLNCRACSVALTYHRYRGERVRCHYCDYLAPLPDRCPECSVGELSLEGLGTEKLQETIAAAFPQAKVGRLDRDVAAGARSERVIARMRAGKIDILVGTQMVTKGHDLPRVTLVGVVNADAALSMPDFRAAERGFQLLVQVAGRAGRRERQGRVFIQTRDPHHPAIVFATTHDVEGFLERELRDRREVGYPPFRRIALLRVNAVAEQLARQVAGRLAAAARSFEQVDQGLVQVLGPAAAPIARLRGRYRFRVFLRASERPPLRAVLARLAPLCAAQDRRARVIIDVDPVSML